MRISCVKLGCSLRVAGGPGLTNCGCPSARLPLRGGCVGVMEESMGGGGGGGRADSVRATGGGGQKGGRGWGRFGVACLAPSVAPVVCGQ